jgi:hypothetical protein
MTLPTMVIFVSAVYEGLMLFAFRFVYSALVPRPLSFLARPSYGYHDIYNAELCQMTIFVVARLLDTSRALVPFVKTRKKRDRNVWFGLINSVFFNERSARALHGAKATPQRASMAKRPAHL